ncbi:hypothetical protein TL16_g13175 [Triparma laevis f. inornata]|uniref:Uncharacterized protein n=2 Tax=Triparma laevis TaxID=1534972 RepID=A0A9W7FV34_9STRA|nr:hypothetical protein TL16_g13175 [Triparma laevis f. inornata]GMI18675.1 hypothetical protein TrLO_g4574 [Triparma laevis f. longispina]
MNVDKENAVDDVLGPKSSSKSQTKTRQDDQGSALKERNFSAVNATKSAANASVLKGIESERKSGGSMEPSDLELQHFEFSEDDALEDDASSTLSNNTANTTRIHPLHFAASPILPPSPLDSTTTANAALTLMDLSYKICNQITNDTMGLVELHPKDAKDQKSERSLRSEGVEREGGDFRDGRDSPKQVLIRSEAEKIYSNLRSKMLSLSQQNHSNSTTTTNDSIFFDASDLFTTKMSTLTAQWFPLFQKSFALVKDLLRLRFSEVVRTSIVEITGSAHVTMPAFSSLVSSMIEKAIDECGVVVEERVEEILRREESPLSLVSGGGEVLEHIRRERVEKFKAKVEDVIENGVGKDLKTVLLQDLGPWFMEAHGAHHSSIRVNNANSIIGMHRRAAGMRAADNICAAIEGLLRDVPGKVEEGLVVVVTEGMEGVELVDLVRRGEGRGGGRGTRVGVGAGVGVGGGKSAKSRQEIRARQVRVRGAERSEDV